MHRQITSAVPTSITAFIGRAARGPTDRPRLVRSFAEFERTYGGLWRGSTLPLAVQQFFLNGGSDALVCRVHNGATAATVALSPDFTLVAASEGQWGRRLRARVDHGTRPDQPGDTAGMLFNLVVKDTATGAVERFPDVSAEAGHSRHVTEVLEEESDLVRVEVGGTMAARPAAHDDPAPGADPLEDDTFSTAFRGGSDGNPLSDADISDAATLEAPRRGLWLLEHADLFNLLVIPPLRPDQDVGQATWDVAAGYAKRRRAMLLVDAPAAWGEAADVTRTDVDAVISQNDDMINAALYFARIRAGGPSRDHEPATFAPSGAVAGIYARTDTRRGVWKAPAGRDAGLVGVAALTVNVTERENAQLNARAVNCLRTFPGIGPVVWGARTRRGTDALASEWKYVSVRRLALFIEESLCRGTEWVVFELNDEALWSQIRSHVGTFLHRLFRKGAFQGRSPAQAYFVRCDAETTTQTDITSGLVNVHVGFAPLRPAEFVVVRIQQKAGAVRP